MDSNRRPKRVAHLIRQTLSRIFLQEFQGPEGLMTITRVEMSADLLTAHVYLSFFGDIQEEEVLGLLEKRKGYLRRSIASEVKLKYNPSLVFHRDQTASNENRIDELIERLKDEEK